MTKALPKLNEIAAAVTAALAPLGLRELPRDSHGWVRRGGTKINLDRATEIGFAISVSSRATPLLTAMPG